MVLKSTNKNLYREFIIALSLALSTYTIFWITDFTEWWFDLTRQYEQYELDELLGLILGGCVGMIYLSFKLTAFYRHDRRRIYQLSKKLNYQANYDQLTALPNRNAFKTFTKELIADSSLVDHKFTLFYIDLDSFKYINDMLGHHVGDMVLVEVTKRLHRVMDEKSTLYRIGGDEFAIIQAGYTDDNACLLMCHELNVCISRPIHIEEHKLYVSQTIGISRYPEDGKSYEQLLRIADIAMYMGKKKGQTSNNFKDGDFIAGIKMRFIIQHSLAEALENNELYLDYQPQIDLASGEVVASEALVRWNHPTHGFIAPNDFIYVAEEIHQVHLIDLYVLEKVCQQIQKWGSKAKPVAVNLSPVLFADESFVNQVFDLMKKYQVANHLLKLEITERTIVADSDIPLLVCQRFSDAGIAVSLDDFGTGYSSMSHIANFPIKELKIDRAFIDQIDKNPRTKNIVNAIIELAKALEIEVVAEGIETEQQLTLLHQLGCDHGQGYLINRPLSLQVYSDMLEAPEMA